MCRWRIFSNSLLCLTSVSDQYFQMKAIVLSQLCHLTPRVLRHDLTGRQATDFFIWSGTFLLDTIVVCSNYCIRSVVMGISISVVRSVDIWDCPLRRLWFCERCSLWFGVLLVTFWLLVILDIFFELLSYILDWVCFYTGEKLWMLPLVIFVLEGCSA